MFDKTSRPPIKQNEFFFCEMLKHIRQLKSTSPVNPRHDPALSCIVFFIYSVREYVVIEESE